MINERIKEIMKKRKETYPKWFWKKGGLVDDLLNKQRLDKGNLFWLRDLLIEKVYVHWLLPIGIFTDANPAN